MTYGWAILIIAVVLGALFALGVFNGGTGVTACVAGSGFLCSGVTYSHTTGNVVATIGQSTGSNWVSAAFAYAPQGSTTNNGIPSVTWNTSRGLTSGSSISTAFAVAAPGSVGATTGGAIWACYVTGTSGVLANAVTCNSLANNAIVQYAQIATLTAKSV